MFEFLGRGKPKADTSGIDPGPSTQFQTVQLSATQIEMVQMTLQGVLKLNGIPGNWIRADVMPVHLPGQGDGVLLQMEVVHWHDALVLHAPALQQALLVALKGFDPQADQTRYLFAWNFLPECGCPHFHLPEPEFWSTSGRVLLPPFIAPSSRTEAVRAPSTAHIQLPQDGEEDDDGFAPTQIPDEH